VETVSRNVRGNGKLGCLLTLLVLAVALFLTYKIGPVYFDKINFEDDLARIVNRAGAENWRDQPIRDQVLATARGMNFEIARNEVRINRIGRFQSASRLRVVVVYRRTVSFPGYTHVFRFESEAVALMGRL
jgi:hypothetical protein